LLATQLISRIQQVFSLELPIGQAFLNQTIEQLITAMSEIIGDRDTLEEIAQVWQEINALSPGQIQLMLKQSK